ncbi:MAG: FliG C-terminal domain-containing protein [Planctomycetota bacterium]
MSERADTEQQAGAQKVAAFLLSLEKDAASEVLKHLDESALDGVASAMSSLREDLGEPEAIEALYKQLAKSLHGRTAVRAANPQELQQRLASALGEERADAVLDGIQKRRLEENPFADIESHSAVVIGAALEAESPAAVALVLAHLDPALSASVLATFDGDRALGIVRRMATLSAPGLQTLICVASSLAEKVQEAASGPIAGDRSTRLQTIAEMLTFTQSDTEQAVLEGLTDDDEEMVDEIREFMFTWSDLAGVDKRSMQKILASVDTRTLAIALKGSPPDVEANIMNNLSSRVKEMVADERDLAGALPLSEVLESRAETMKGVRALMDSGEFKPVRGGEDLVS